jgi:O-antigen/teichoic acid export membrane protein
VLASSKYAGAERIVPVLLAGLLIYATNVFVAAGLLIHKRTMTMAGLLVIAAVLNVGVNVVLLPRMGLMGGAIATLVSYAVCILLLAKASNRLLPLTVNLKALAQNIGAAVVASLLASQATFGPAVVTVIGRSVIVFVVYGAALYMLDSRARGIFLAAYSWCRERAL